MTVLKLSLQNDFGIQTDHDKLIIIENARPELRSSWVAALKKLAQEYAEENSRSDYGVDDVLKVIKIGEDLTCADVWAGAKPEESEIRFLEFALDSAI